eukprot:Sdes_comp24332_c0_seq1m22305
MNVRRRKDLKESTSGFLELNFEALNASETLKSLKIDPKISQTRKNIENDFSPFPGENFEGDFKSVSSNKNPAKFSQLMPYYSFFFYLLLCSVIVFTHFRLPSPLSANIPADIFSEGRAFH